MLCRFSSNQAYSAETIRDKAIDEVTDLRRFVWILHAVMGLTWEVTGAPTRR
jgi:hypothetical protein